MRRRVAFDEPVGTDDGFGGEVIAWTQRYECAAEFIYMRGGEGPSSGRYAEYNSFKIRIRSSADARALTAAYRMRDARTGEAYNVREVDALSDRQWVYLVAERGVQM